MRWPTARQRPSSSGRSCVLAVSTDSCRIGRLFVRRRRTRKVFARLLPAEPYWRERGPGGVVVAAGTPRLKERSQLLQLAEDARPAGEGCCHAYAGGPQHHSLRSS